jgi:hypothetical protein
MAVVQNITLGTLTDEIHLDAVIDTGSTLCVVPPIFARQLVIPSFRGPNGNVGPVLTAWALDPDVGEASPHLVTAFPLV